MVRGTKRFTSWRVAAFSFWLLLRTAKFYIASAVIHYKSRCITGVSFCVHIVMSNCTGCKIRKTAGTGQSACYL
jgi:uncharacterized membrane protein